MSYARLDVTDTRDLPGCHIEQRLGRLNVELGDHSRAEAFRSSGGAVVLFAAGAGGRVALSLPAEAALRLGAHVAALGQAALEPEADASLEIGDSTPHRGTTEERR